MACTDKKTKQTHLTLGDAVRVSLFVAVISVTAQIVIPLSPVPVTMQLWGIFLGLFLLGGKRGTVAVLVYLCLGALGVPVFSSFRGGADVLLSPTGGYLVGFLVSALVYWALSRLLRIPVAPAPLPVAKALLAALPALAACYTFGTLWYAVAYAGGKSIGAILGICVLPFLLPDAAKLALAVSVAAVPHLRKAAK